MNSLLVLLLGLSIIVPSELRDLIPGEDDANIIPEEPPTLSIRKVTPKSCDELASAAIRNHNDSTYLTFSQIEERLIYLDCIYDTINLEVAGYTHENRPIYLVKISSKNQKVEEDFIPAEASFKRGAMSLIRAQSGNELSKKVGKNSKSVIFVDAGIHAREWAAPATALHFIEILAKNPTEAMLDHFDWHIMPLLNPDGYAYTWTGTENRMWRKNRAPLHATRCVGVDLNRNAEVSHTQTVKIKCSFQYGGDSPFSEPETRALRDSINSVRGYVKAYITLHSYGRVFLYPFGYSSTKRAKTRPELVKMGNVMAQAIKNKHGTVYDVNQASLFGAAAGGTDDWAYLKAGVPYSYTFELPPSYKNRQSSGHEGFALGEAKLPRVVREAWTGVQALAQKIYTMRAGQDGPLIKTSPEVDFSHVA